MRSERGTGRRAGGQIFPSSLTLYNTSSFLTRSVQLLFFNLLQHLISKHSRYFRSTLRSVQVSAPHKPMLQMQHFTGFFLQFNPYQKEMKLLFCVAVSSLEQLHLSLKTAQLITLLSSPLYVAGCRKVRLLRHSHRQTFIWDVTHAYPNVKLMDTSY